MLRSLLVGGIGIVGLGAAASSSALSSVPSSIPSRVPSSIPSSIPLAIPSSVASSIPSKAPSSIPSRIPSSILSSAPSTSSLPIVDLGYEIHQASFFNATGGFYNFSNIRYAQPPVGELRFAAPLAPTGRNTTVNNGSVGKLCPQASPKWELTTATFVLDYLTGQKFNASAAATSVAGQSSGYPKQDPRTTEDCLFLDVVVPQKIFAKANASTFAMGSSVSQIADGQIQASTGPSTNGAGAPVLVWIYGGGYTNGDKSGNSAAGLIKASQANGTSDGLIFVSINYRLGAFGWLSGPTLQSNGTANAGLYDQRLALQWVQDKIHLFGGNPKNVTVIGESAGGGSIMNQITAFGGNKGPAPFHQAILQSPAFQNLASYYQQEQIFNTFLNLTNVSTVEEARKLPYSTLQMANIVQVGNSSYGQFTYGPVVDGLFAPAVPGKLLLQGSFDKNLKIMVGHNADEGLIFSSPNITNDTTFNQYVQDAFPTIQPAVASYVENTLYPPNMTGILGTTGYSDETGRVDLIIAESSFTCNTYFLDRAFGNDTYAYQFSVAPALHGQDIAYTFFNGPGSTVASDQTALALQQYITSFAINGTPSGNMSLPMFPLYGNNSQIIDLNATSITQTMDPTANYRCIWWQKELYA